MVEGLGFKAEIKRNDDEIDYDHKVAVRFWLINFLVSLVFFFPTLVIMLMPKTPAMMKELSPGVNIEEIVMFVLGTCSIGLVGRPFFRSGFAALKHLTPNMDSLISISVG